MEDRLGMKANVKYLPPQKAAMQATWANVGKAAPVADWRPKVSLDEGIQLTVDWDNHHTPVDVSLIY
jgi:nucleoside-diphosphate-sugar epimerase